MKIEERRIEVVAVPYESLNLHQIDKNQTAKRVRLKEMPVELK